MHVAFIANWPGTVAPGQVRDDLVDVADLFSTAFEAGGVTINNVRQANGSFATTTADARPVRRPYEAGARSGLPKTGPL